MLQNLWCIVRLLLHRISDFRFWLVTTFLLGHSFHFYIQERLSGFAFTADILERGDREEGAEKSFPIPELHSAECRDIHTFLLRHSEDDHLHVFNGLLPHAAVVFLAPIQAVGHSSKLHATTCCRICNVSGCMSTTKNCP